MSVMIDGWLSAQIEHVQVAAGLFSRSAQGKSLWPSMRGT